MPVFNVSAARAFGFKDNPGLFGHLTSFQIGKNTLVADMTLETPLGGGDVNIVGALSDITWGGESPGAGDPIHISAEISPENAMQVKALSRLSRPDDHVTFSFVVYHYDQENKAYYVACQGAADGKPLNSRLLEHTLAVSDEGAAPVPGGGIVLFRVVAELLPDTTGQNIALAQSSTKRYIKRWGIDVKETAPEEMASTTA
jgi:hypothetical protein